MIILELTFKRYFYTLCTQIALNNHTSILNSKSSIIRRQALC